MFRSCILLLLLLLSLSVSAFADELDAILSKEQQIAIGIDHQTPAQREALRRILVDVYRVAYADGQKAGTKQTVSPGHPQISGVIESRIDGEYKGWEGETIYKLMNGEIWQQASYHYHYHYAYSPEVIVYPFNGGYKMKVDGDDDEPISVRRIR